MIVVSFGYFTVNDPAARILFYTNEDGMDWYALRSVLTTWDFEGEFVDAVFGAFATVDENGILRNVEYNPSRLVPDNRMVIGIDAHHSDIQPGMVLVDGELHPPTAESLEVIGPPLQVIRN